VITIIVILAGLLIASVPMLKKQMMKISTRNTIGVGVTALESQKAAGTLSAPVCHPLAASATCGHFFGETGNRAIFVRSVTRQGVSAFQDAVPLSGGLITTSTSAWLHANDIPKQMFADDIFVGSYDRGDVPLLYGLRRDLCCVLAPNVEWISSFRELPTLVDATGAISVLYSSSLSNPKYIINKDQTADHDSAYADREFLRAASLPVGQTYESLSEEIFVRNFGLTLSELTAKSAVVKTPDSSTKAAPIVYRWVRTDLKGTVTSQPLSRYIDAVEPVSGDWDPRHRVHFVEQTPETSWCGGYDATPAGSRMKIQLKNVEGWYRYRPRGTCLVDAYGTELLYCQDSYGNIKLLSAGADGCFVLHPGGNGTIETPIVNYDVATGTFGTFVDDDRDARKDNLP
jgi:hypothetical protein